MGPQRKMGIYVSYDLLSIIYYLEPLTRDLFTVCFADCYFDNIFFMLLGGDKHANVPGERHELSWYALTMSHLDPYTTQSETKVRRIIDLQSIAQSMSDAFTDLAKVTRSHIPAANAPTRIGVLRVRRNPAWEGQIVPEGERDAPSTWPGILAASQSPAPTLKCGRPLGSKDSQPPEEEISTN
ncbi:hypothetical protein PS1_007390 [Malus domestica]